jgi:hypothetical protein
MGTEMSILESLKNEAYRYSQFNHQQYGHLAGMFMGLGFGLYVAISFDTVKPSWTVDGTLTESNWYFNESLRVCVVPLTSGLFANLFSNMGAGIDVMTNKKTFLSVLVDKCGKKMINKNSFFAQTPGSKISIDYENETLLQQTPSSSINCSNI